MTAPNRELLKNNATTSLSGTIDDNDVSVAVVDGAVFPSTGNFRLICEDEIMLCTARSSNTLTVVRGVEGSTPVSHTSAPITHIITDGSFNRIGADNVPLWGAFPPLNHIVDDSGETIDSSDFTVTNQGGSTITDLGGTIGLRIPPNNSGENVRVLSRTAPSPTYSYIAAFQYLLNGHADTSINACGFGFRESGTGKLTILCISCDPADTVKSGFKFVIYNWNSPTSFDSVEFAGKLFGYAGSALWVKVADDNTDLIFSISVDGVEWIEYHTMARTDFMSGAPDEVCWIGSTVNNPDTDQLIRLCHFSRAS